MVHSISILGSTGSIGRQTVAVAEHLGLNVRALTTNRNIQLAEEQARRLHPAFVAVTDETAARALRIALADTDIAVGSGENALCEAAVLSDTDAVVTAVSGAVGLRPTLAAIEKGRRIALANKETLVCAGDIVMRRARELRRGDRAGRFRALGHFPVPDRARRASCSKHPAHRFRRPVPRLDARRDARCHARDALSTTRTGAWARRSAWTPRP